VRETARFAGVFVRNQSAPVLLAMQKVEGSNPFSRFEKRLQNAGVSA
jgi:hypothetical protein